jgi:AAA15 family ATPase/GTPase
MNTGNGSVHKKHIRDFFTDICFFVVTLQRTLTTLTPLIMLLRFNVKNFLSFHKEAAFDMFPNIKREKFSHHIYAGMEVPLLKQAAIYGANGSGKSNFVKALYFLREFVTHDDFLKAVDLDDYIFQLTSEKSPTISFEVEFLQHGRYYIYSAGISKKEIYEKLSFSGLGKSENELLFERSGGRISSPHLQNESAAKQLLSMNSQSSLLPLNLKFPILANNDVEKAYDWFSTKLEVVAIHTAIPMLIKLLSQRSEVLNFANTVFENIGIGIKKVEVSDMPFEKWAVKSKNAAELQQIIGGKSAPSDRNIELLQGNRNVLNVTFQKGVKTALELLFDQLGQSGFHKEMKISAQSDGTVRLLTLIPVLYSAM